MVYESISIFDMFKVGIGPSSSHTLGPWIAVQRWIEELEHEKKIAQITDIKVILYGSLALTGKGHCTDKAICLAFLGYDPKSIDTNNINEYIKELNKKKTITLGNSKKIKFNPSSDIVFNTTESLPYHSNAMKFIAYTGISKIESTFYSTGGGFVEKEGENMEKRTFEFPYPATKPKELLSHCKKNKLSISEIVMKNESTITSAEKVKVDILKIWSEMKESAFRGCHSDGILPGGLNVKRHAGKFNKTLIKSRSYSNSNEWINAIKSNSYLFNETLKWISCFALAINEENASLGRVVTAPTNGSAGVIPAVILYHICFSNKKVDENDIIKFLLVAGEIGTFFKKRATISAALGGCQAEIGVSSAMAAAALCELRGGSPAQAFNAAEIAMEHHLGMTCDPIGGLVQIPCIERNAMGATKAINAAELALEKEENSTKVSLDDIIETMWDTAKNMNDKYKETSKGGLAITVNIPEC